MTHIEPVETESGKVAGRRSDGLAVFLGIPYAAPPVGPLRLRPPQPVPPWPGVRDAMSYGPDAPQRAPVAALYEGLDDGGLPPQSEDCLSLNIWTPGCDSARRPVMVWIHGGGYTSGGARRPVYDGTALARGGGLVFVSINYRLGILGLASHPELADEQTGDFANWCLLDQIAALEWIRRNIERFGGDPAQVTVFGESAGGGAVSLLMLAPRARGLFQRAIVQSSSPRPASLDQGALAVEELCKAVGCRPRELRRVEVAKLLDAQPSWARTAGAGLTAPRPVLEGRSLPHGPFELANAGGTREIDLLIGSNRDEVKLFLRTDPARQSMDEPELRRRLDRLLRGAPEEPDALIETYRTARRARGESLHPWELFCALISDRMMRVPALQLLERHTRAGGRGFSYLVTWESPLHDLGACHAIELPLVFGTLGAPGIDRFTGSGPQAAELSGLMGRAWTAFARGEDPGVPGLGDWPAYAEKSRPTMVFGPSPGCENAPREPERAAWGNLLGGDSTAHRVAGSRVPSSSAPGSR